MNKNFFIYLGCIFIILLPHGWALFTSSSDTYNKSNIENSYIFEKKLSYKLLILKYLLRLIKKY